MGLQFVELIEVLTGVGEVYVFVDHPDSFQSFERVSDRSSRQHRLLNDALLGEWTVVFEHLEHQFRARWEIVEILPTNAVLVNTARGSIVDTDALVSALRSNAIRGAALDVTDPEPLPEDHPLWNLENCLVTPHTGGHTPRHWERLADIVAENVQRLADGETLDNQVLAPESD